MPQSHVVNPKAFACEHHTGPVQLGTYVQRIMERTKMTKAAFLVGLIFAHRANEAICPARLQKTLLPCHQPTISTTATLAHGLGEDCGLPTPPPSPLGSIQDGLFDTPTTTPGSHDTHVHTTATGTTTTTTTDRFFPDCVTWAKVEYLTMCPFCHFVSTALLADKYLYDERKANSVWAAVSGIPVNVLNKLERNLLYVLDFELFVTPEVFARWMAKYMSQAGDCMTYKLVMVALRHQIIGLPTNPNFAISAKPTTSTNATNATTQTTPATVVCAPHGAKRSAAAAVDSDVHVMVGNVHAVKRARGGYNNESETNPIYPTP